MDCNEQVGQWSWRNDLACYNCFFTLWKLPKWLVTVRICSSCTWVKTGLFLSLLVLREMAIQQLSQSWVETRLDWFAHWVKPNHIRTEYTEHGNILRQFLWLWLVPQVFVHFFSSLWSVYLKTNLKNSSVILRMWNNSCFLSKSTNKKRLASIYILKRKKEKTLYLQSLSLRALNYRQARKKQQAFLLRELSLRISQSMLLLLCYTNPIGRRDQPQCRECRRCRFSWTPTGQVWQSIFSFTMWLVMFGSKAPSSGNATVLTMSLLFNAMWHSR